MKILLLLLALGCLALLLSACSKDRRVEQLGLLDGHLRPCTGSPNCVSSESPGGDRKIAPFLLRISSADGWAALKKAIATLPRTQIVLQTGNYLHAECRSAVFGFVDDLELHLEPKEQKISVRSAARLGYYDFGVNRKRVEDLRQTLRAAGIVR